MRNRIQPLRRRLLGRGVLRRERSVIRRLADAHRWMEQGRFDRAANRYAKLAARAERLGLPIAALLMVQAGRAFVADRQLDAAEMSFARGFEVMHDQGDPRLGPVSRQVLTDLRRDGHEALADSLGSTLPAGLDLAQAPGDSQRAKASRLPAKCPYCGGSVHAEQVDRTDPDRPNCAYCGSPLLGDEPRDE